MDNGDSVLERRREGVVMDATESLGKKSSAGEPDTTSRILVDSPGNEATFDREILARMGHNVMACEGPDASRQCPILDGGHCDLVDQAHGIVFELDLDDETHRRILARYVEEIDSGIPLRVRVQPGQGDRYADLLSDVEVWTEDPSVADLDAFSSRVEAYERTDRPD